ncbi:MAG: aspartate aminotransferase family protein [Candidatus Omnitrophota bacterium]|nr:aspartate aminotransferase family protein [Candidatus Omnitrophota bacterium]
MTDTATVKTFQQYVLNTYRRIGPIFTKGKGSWLWDTRGNRYLDLFPGWGVSILGHCHPGIVRAINAQAKKLIHLPNNLYQREHAVLAKTIVQKSFSSKVFFANSGAEAVEGAVKVSRLYGKGCSRHEIISMKNSFHGRTFAALSATGQAKYKEPFEPLLPTFKEALFNDASDVARLHNEHTVGVLLELIQGEGGINIASKEYVKKLYAYCRHHKLLFMVDEVQTGMGRTGKLFAYQHYGITPDIMILSKGLGAGVPISALVVNTEIADIIKPGMHASTFGGSPLVTHVGNEVFKIIKKERLLDNTRSMGTYLAQAFQAMRRKFSFIRDVRGVGLMIGVDLTCASYPVFMECLKNKLIVNSTHDTVLRIMPALTVTKRELDTGIRIIEDAFSTCAARGELKK